MTAKHPNYDSLYKGAPILGVVVITRNEERHIAACLSAILPLREIFPDTSVVVVDSSSTDNTVSIAMQYPVSIYRYRAPVLTAAAGRRIGFDRTRAKYVLFVDGDCCIHSAWVKKAVDLLDHHPDVGVTYGTRQEVLEGVPDSYESINPKPHGYDLGGNALYRSEVLHAVDGFNPFIIADEEAELLARIKALGYRAVQMPDVMVTHYTLPKDSLLEFVRRLRRGYSLGCGQVLRVSLHNRHYWKPKALNSLQSRL